MAFPLNFGDQFSVLSYLEKLHHQTDNARPHVAKSTLKFKDDYARATGGKIIVMPDQQAPRCPESNVMDLTVFSWMQDYVDAKEVVTRDELRVMSSWIVW